jgi:hypothetical protein
MGVDKSIKANKYMPKGLVKNSTRMQTAAYMFAQAVKKGIHKPASVILKEAGYTPQTAKRTAEVMNKPSFQALLQKYLPMERIVNTHKQLLEQTEDKGVQLRATELGYKVSGVVLDRSQSAHFHVSAPKVSWSE